MRAKTRKNASEPTVRHKSHLDEFPAQSDLGPIFVRDNETGKTTRVRKP